MTKAKDYKKIKKWSEEVLDIESKALQEVKAGLDESFFRAIDILYSAKGRIVVTGMGKAGIIGKKFSATLSSTGSSSFWLHPAEAVHGDLGRIKDTDVVFVLSYSGETEEIANLIPFIKNIGASIVALTGNKDSNLARYADAVIAISIEKEACPLGLAPTTSTTVMLAVCDAVAVCLQKLKGFKEKDFAMFHPRGSLGRKLLLKVGDVMRRGRLSAVVNQKMLVKDVLNRITESKAGAASVVDEDNKLVGIFTDGDLRRKLASDSVILDKQIKEVMTKKPVVVSEDQLASEVLKLLEDKKIDEVPVVDKNFKIIGILDVQDLIAAGVV